MDIIPSQQWFKGCEPESPLHLRIHNEDRSYLQKKNAQWTSWQCRKVIYSYYFLPNIWPNPKLSCLHCEPTQPWLLCCLPPRGPPPMLSWLHLAPWQPWLPPPPMLIWLHLAPWQPWPADPPRPSEPPRMFTWVQSPLKQVLPVRPPVLLSTPKLFWPQKGPRQPPVPPVLNLFLRFPPPMKPPPKFREGRRPNNPWPCVREVKKAMTIRNRVVFILISGCELIIGIRSNPKGRLALTFKSSYELIYAG